MLGHEPKEDWLVWSADLEMWTQDTSFVTVRHLWTFSGFKFLIILVENFKSVFSCCFIETVADFSVACCVTLAAVITGTEETDMK